MENEMIKNFTTEQLTKMIYSKLEPLEYEITLSKPTMENAFPIIVILTPLESIQNDTIHKYWKRNFKPQYNVGQKKNMMS